MALWSLFVEVGRTRYSTQVTADDPKAAIRSFLASGGLKGTLKGLAGEGWPRSFAMKDVFAFLPMDGLINMYLCQLGRKGKYVSVVLARTVSRQQA
jgi:hypothetical protein